MGGEFRDPGKDANIFWGVCGQAGRYRIYLMLPEKGEAQELEDLHPFVYDAMYTTAGEVAAGSITNWSPDYQAELSRTAYFTNSSHHTESRKSIPEAIGREFADDFMDRIHEYDWGTNAYWFLQIRGAKDLTRHSGPIDQETIATILTGVLQHRSIIFLDMGLEIHLPNAWASMPARQEESHLELARIAWGIDPDNEWDWALYEPDVWAGVETIAGFRCNFSAQPRTLNRISYVQVYTSDKFQTYNSSSHGSKALRLRGDQVLNMSEPDSVPTPITKVYEVTCTNQTARTPVVTRLEARVLWKAGRPCPCT